MLHRLSSQIPALIAIAVLTACAALASVFFSGHPSRTMVPLVFAVLAIAVSVRFGALAGIGRSLIGAAVFASFLFPPLGTVRVEDAASRAELGWMVLAGISLSYLLAGRELPSDKKHPK